MKIKFIVNPKSSSGKTKQRWPQIYERLKNDIPNIDVIYTEARNDATKFTREALHNGYEQIVAVGGDGTINEVINGFFEKGKPINPNAAFSLIMTGTGGDFIRSLDLPRTYEQTIESIKNGKPRKIDLGKVTFLEQDIPERYFVNMSGFALAGLTVKIINNSKYIKPIGGKAGYLLLSLASSFLYKGVKVRMTLDNGEVIEKKVRNVAIANARFQGGGLMMAPDAKLDDGLLDVVVMDNISPLTLTIFSSLFYTGKHLNKSWMKVYKTKKIKAESERETLVDVDGEFLGRLPLEVEVVPQAITIKM